MRPNIHEYFMDIAKVVATRSTCIRHNVGAVIVRDKRIIATGYNGAPRGLAHCLDVGCIRDKENIESGTQTERCMAVHSEINAIIQAALHGVSTDGTTLYCTHQPCSSCTKAIINAGIIEVVYEKEYPDNMAIELFNMANIKVIKFDYQIEELQNIIVLINKWCRRKYSNIFFNEDIEVPNDIMNKLVERGQIIKLGKAYRAGKYPGTSKFSQQWGLITKT